MKYCGATERNEAGEWVCIRERHGTENHYYKRYTPVPPGHFLIMLSNVFLIVAMIMLVLGLAVAWFDIMPECSEVIQ